MLCKCLIYVAFFTFVGGLWWAPSIDKKLNPHGLKLEQAMKIVSPGGTQRVVVPQRKA